MSDSDSMTLKSISSRNGVRVAMIGTLLAATAMVLPPMNFSDRVAADRQRPVLVKMIEMPQDSAQPSAFDEESGMSASHLLNRWDALMEEASKRFDVPKAWIRAVMQRESGGRTMLGSEQPMVSHAGALGLMQVLPGTFKEMSEQYKLGDNPFDAHDNIMAGAAYLRWLHHKYGFPAMFAAYNAGPGRLEDHLYHGEKLPAETRAYVGGITRVLNPRFAGEMETVKFTRPDGAKVRIDTGRITAIRAAMPGEYAPSVKTVISMGRHRQGVREPLSVAMRAVGHVI